MAEGDKTEKATPKKRRDERKKGNVFLSKDVVAVATLLGAYMVLRALAGWFPEKLGNFMEFCLERSGDSFESLQGILSELLLQGLMVVLATVGPLLAIGIACAVAATFAQTKFLVTGESLKPKFSRLNPLQGIKQLFSLKSIVETLKNLLKITLLMVIIYLSVRDML